MIVSELLRLEARMERERQLLREKKPQNGPPWVEDSGMGEGGSIRVRTGLGQEGEKPEWSLEEGHKQ